MADNDVLLEQHYRRTWLCKTCGARNALGDNVCPQCDQKDRGIPMVLDWGLAPEDIK